MLHTSVAAITYPAGTSPFRVKGLAWRAAREYYDRAVPGGMDAVKRTVSAMGDDALTRYLDTPFVASGWYDVLPALPVSQTAARMAGVPHPQFMRDYAAWMAHRDLRGAYRAILRLASVEMVALRLPRLSMQYLNFGRAEGQRVRDRLIHATRYGIPSCLASWFIFATYGFTAVALELAGGKNVRVRHTKPLTDGYAGGMSLVQIPFEVEWD